jgi:hypothetical protein
MRCASAGSLSRGQKSSSVSLRRDHAPEIPQGAALELRRELRERPFVACLTPQDEQSQPQIGSSFWSVFSHQRPAAFHVTVYRRLKTAKVQE